jgi:hypothetical protein
VKINIPEFVGLPTLYMKVSDKSLQAVAGIVPATALSVSERTSVCPTDVTIVDRTNALIRGLELILQHHSVQCEIRVVLFKQVHDYLDSSIDESVWGKKAKSLLTYPLAKYLRNDPPAAPECGYFKPSGRARRWMKSKLLNYCRKNTHLWYSWLQCKKATLDSSEEVVLSTYAEHCKVLVNKDDGDDTLIDEIFAIPAFQHQLERIAVAATDHFCKDKIFTEYQPSTSASLNSARSAQGAYGELCGLINQPEDIYPCDLVSMEYLPFTNGRSCHKVFEVRCCSTLLGQDWEDGLSKLYFERRPHTLQAKIQGIVEPMKVRVISKGPALEYYASKPLQRALHTVMRTMDCYRLIGRPLCPTDLLDCKVKADPSWEWFSVDYKAATDNLSWKYSGRILRALIKYWSPRMQELALDVLGPHELVYPNAARIKSQKMERGQLMGSVLSFPILCIANYGLYLSVTNSIQMGWSDAERESHVLINGDDQAYAAPSHLWEDHVEKGRKVGLEMSVGKAYHHARYCNVNSTSIDLPMMSKCPYQITYLNSGLFFGISKVRSKTDVELKQKDIVSLLPKVLAGSLPNRQCSLLGHWFITHPSKTIRDCCEISIGVRKTIVRSIFMPQSLGGMGVDAPIGWKHYRSHKQLVYASTFAIKMHLGSSRPLPGYEPREFKAFLEKPYMKAPVYDLPPQSVCGKSYIVGLKVANLPIVPYAPHRECYVL